MPAGLLSFIKLGVLLLILCAAVVIAARQYAPLRHAILSHTGNYRETVPLQVGPIEQVADRLYVVPGAGGNTAVFITARGVVLVDTKSPGGFDALMEQVRRVTDKPVIMAINTHFHRDHCGGNDELPPAAEIIVQDNTLRTMRHFWHEPTLKNLLTPHWYPTRTFTDQLTLFSGEDTIELFHYGPAHTAGDLVVVFRAAGVMHAGDVFSAKATPIINADWGGDGLNLPQFQQRMQSLPGIHRIITGHDGVLEPHDLAEYQAFCSLLVDDASAAYHAGHTAQQAAQDFQLPSEYRDYHMERLLSTFQEIYLSLERPAAERLR